MGSAPKLVIPPADASVPLVSLKQKRYEPEPRTSKGEQPILTQVKRLKKMVSRDLVFKILGAIAFCMVVVGYFFYREYQQKQPEIVRQNILYKNFSGIVDSTYTVHMDHGSTTIVFKDRKVLSGFQGHLFTLLKKNDSIVKRKGEDSIYIYRDGIMKSYKY